MKTKNQFRIEKAEEIKQIWDMYPDLSEHERLFVVLDELVRKAMARDDYTELASIHEYAALLGDLFINARTGRPNADARNWVSKLITALRKDKGHPHIRPYTEPHVEISDRGEEIVRNYLNLLRGKLAIIRINNRLEGQITGLQQAQKENTELKNIRQVMKEAEAYREELEIKQQDANSKRKRGNKKR